MGLVTLYLPQIMRALSWTAADPITLPLREEIEQVINLFYALAASVRTSAKSNAAVERILSGFTVNALRLPQQINYAITYPNHLASLYEPLTQEERVRFEKAQQSQADPLKLTFVAHPIHRLFQLSSSLVGTLVAIGRADKVLLNGPDDWPISYAVIILVCLSHPHFMIYSTKLLIVSTLTLSSAGLRLSVPCWSWATSLSTFCATLCSDPQGRASPTPPRYQARTQPRSR